MKLLQNHQKKLSHWKIKDCKMQTKEGREAEDAFEISAIKTALNWPEI